MALAFNELLGKPFAPAVKRELEKRRSLNQRYETSPTLHNPYFKLRRIESMSDNEDLNRESRKTRDNIKFWELNKLSKQGLDDIKDKVDNGGNAKAPVGITDVTIEVKDYTFHTLEVNFVVPDVTDWEAFKETWLVFGAPVEYEFGRESLVDIEDNEDVTPEKEIREGLIANFSWSMGEQNRTITGSLTIYSATYVELTNMAHSSKSDGIDIGSLFRDSMKDLYAQDSNKSNIINFYGTAEQSNISNFEESQLNPDDDLDAKFIKKSKYFYSVMNENDYETRVSRLEQLEGAKESDEIKLTFDENNLKFYSVIPFGVDVISGNHSKISKEVQSGLEKSGNVSNTTLHKYAVSELRLDKEGKNELETDIYFYVSMRFINDLIKFIIRYNYNVLDEGEISNIDLLDVKIRDLSHLGLGSSEPDKVVVDPWDRSYSINDDFDPVEKKEHNMSNLYEDSKEYILDSSGEYKLLEDVFLSAPLVLDIAVSSDSPLEFIENIISEIESATKGLIRLEKSEKVVAKDNKFLGKTITYFDIATIEDEGNDYTTYHKFNLFDYREKIRNIDVNSDLSDDFSQYAYFRSTDKINKGTDIFVYENQYYKNDGSKAVNTQREFDRTKTTGVLSERERKRLEDKYGVDSMQKFIKRNVLDMNDKPNIENVMTQYMKNGQEVIDTYQSLYNGILDSNKERLTKFLQSKDTEDFEKDTTIALLSFIQAYFSVITDVYQLSYNPFDNKGSTTIPLKVDISLDGIAGIVTGQVFKIDLSSFPMAYNISNTTPLFVVSTLSHSITENNDWETTIGGFLYIPASAQQDAIRDSSYIENIIGSENARLQIIKDIFESNIYEILNEDS